MRWPACLRRAGLLPLALSAGADRQQVDAFVYRLYGMYLAVLAAKYAPTRLGVPGQGEAPFAEMQEGAGGAVAHYDQRPGAAPAPVLCHGRLPRPHLPSIGGNILLLVWGGRAAIPLVPPPPLPLRLGAGLVRADILPREGEPRLRRGGCPLEGRRPRRRRLGVVGIARRPEGH